MVYKSKQNSLFEFVNIDDIPITKMYENAPVNDRKMELLQLLVFVPETMD